LSLALRVLRSRWITIPLRLVGGLAAVILAVVLIQLALQVFVPGPTQPETLGGLTASLAASLFTSGVALLAYTGYVRLTERRRPAELQPRPALWELPAGILLGLGLCAASVGVIWILGGYRVDGVADRSTWASSIMNGLTISVISGVVEELALRGLVLRILAEVFGRWWALAISALLFGVLHMANPGSSVIVGLALVVEAGFLLGVAYLWTQRLWLPIGLHAAWNFAQATIFGGALSGYQVSAIIDAKLVGPEWISGGAFGIEGSVVSTIICCAAACAILWQTLRKGATAARDRDGLDLSISDVEATLLQPDDGHAEVS
jgi:membrane protease YdiL (CAAX protease family)